MGVAVSPVRVLTSLTASPDSGLVRMLPGGTDLFGGMNGQPALPYARFTRSFGSSCGALGLQDGSSAMSSVGVGRSVTIRRAVASREAVYPPAAAGHFMQVMLDHLRGLQRDVHLLMEGRHPQARGRFQRRAALVRAVREVRRRAVRAGGPGQVRSRGALLLTRLAGRPFRAWASPAAVSDRAGHQRTGPWRPWTSCRCYGPEAPQFPRPLQLMPPNESVRLAAGRSSSLLNCRPMTDAMMSI